MANDLKILITGSLDKVKSITEINSVIGQIADDPKLRKLSVNIAVSDAQLNNVVRQISQIQEKLNALKAPKIVPDVVPIREVYTEVDKAVAKYKELGQVKVTQNFDPITKEVQGFQLQVTKATGEVDKLKFELASLKGIQGIDGFVQTGSTTVDNTQAILERQLQQEQAINQTINQRTQALQEQVTLYQRQAELQATNLTNNSNKVLSSDQQASLQNYLNSVRALNAETPNVQNQMRNLSQDFREISTQASTATSSSSSFSDSLKTAFSSFSIWMVAATGVMQVWQSIREGITYVNQLNDSLTQISIVTGQTQSQVAALGEQYNKLAQSMGVTTQEIANEATELYRQGLTQDQVESRMKVITEYAKISSLDTKTASEIMTAAINSMGVSATKAADVWSYLGDATATGADEIGQAMQKVGGTAGALKIPFEEVSSWVSVISSRTRESATTIGDSVKSILARVQSLKENGYDAVDNTSVNQVSKALKTIGIQLVDSQGQFRNFGTVMNEIGAKWNTLDSRQKAYIATTVAG